MAKKHFTILIEQDGECIAIQKDCPSKFEKCEERAKVLLRAFVQNYPCAEACIYESDSTYNGYICKVLFVDCFNDISSYATFEYDGTNELSEREEDRYNRIWEDIRYYYHIYKVDADETNFDWLKP